MSFLDAITDDRPTATRSLTFAFLAADATRLREAQSEAQMWKVVESMRESDDAAVLVARLDDAKAKAAEILDEIRTITVNLAGIGAARFHELVAAHPPTTKAKTEGRARANGNPAGEPLWNEDTFAPALLAETVVSITDTGQPDSVQNGLTIDEATKLWQSKWSEGDKTLLLDAAASLDLEASLVEALGND